MMKIVSGQFGGRKLLTPKNKDIRPTSDKIRGAVFNMLQSRAGVDDAYVLDAFCGTGALGFEALSRGAQHCCFIDKARTSLSLAQDNAQMLKIEDSCDFLLKDSSKLGKRPEAINPRTLIFLDPPYNKDLITKTLPILQGQGWIAPNAWIICESERSYDLPTIEGIKIDQEKTYGDIKITIAQSA